MADRFEDMRVWREARALSALIDEACVEIAKQRNYALSNQMRRAAISVVSNISEGFDRRSPRSFRYFLLIAKGSLAELRAQLFLCEDRTYLVPARAIALNERAAMLSRMLGGLIRYLENTFPELRSNEERGTRNLIALRRSTSAPP